MEEIYRYQMHKVHMECPMGCMPQFITHTLLREHIPQFHGPWESNALCLPRKKKLLPIPRSFLCQFQIRRLVEMYQ
ncbi:C2H2 domain protein [Gallid alphaherpesvirus 2]|nr:C2H2 domain protein [Gallid alphaherpesvirus 2]